MKSDDALPEKVIERVVPTEQRVERLSFEGGRRKW